jgi:uncharacterized membrane protein
MEKRGIFNPPNRKFAFYLLLLISIGVLCQFPANIPPVISFSLLLSMLLGSLIEIPLPFTIRTKKPSYSMQEAGILEKIYSVPVWKELSGTERVYDSRITLNLGGFFVPLLVASYFLGTVLSFRDSTTILLEILLLFFLVLVLTNFLSEVRSGVGIVVPNYIGLLLVPLAIVLQVPVPLCPPAFLIFISGSIGILAGVILLLISMKREEEGSAFFNIGGTGSFDAVFMVAVLSVLASFL